MANSDQLAVTILGCGSSGGVPRIGQGWGACDPHNPKNRRRRCSVLIERHGAQGTTIVLVDTGPDVRQQLLDARVDHLDAILYTHEHADHTHGIDELRALVVHTRRRIRIYADARTSCALHRSFSYCFETPPGSGYPPILQETRIRAGEPVSVAGLGGDIVAMPFAQRHGGIHSLGFRFGDLAYSSDVSDLDETALKHLRDLKIWIVDALRIAPHRTHFNVERALYWIDRLRPQRAILTNLHTDLDYETLCRELPETVEPAYDGLQVFVPVGQAKKFP